MLNKFILILASIVILHLLKRIKGKEIQSVNALLWGVRLLLAFTLVQDITLNFFEYNTSVACGYIASIIILIITITTKKEKIFDGLLVGIAITSIPIFKMLKDLQSVSEVNTYLNSISLVRASMIFKITVLSLAYWFVLLIAPRIITKITQQLQIIQSGGSRTNMAGIENAGLWIGRLERVLILTLILIKKEEIVSWVVAIKGLLRFGEIQTLKTENAGDAEKNWELIKNKIRIEVEYIIIGTLASLAIVVIVGVITRIILKI